MPIDVTKPADLVPSIKADLRNNLIAIAAGIGLLDSANSSTGITVNAASFGDSQMLRLRCTAATAAVTVTLANNVPAGRSLEIVQYGTGGVTAVAGSGATIVKVSSASLVTVSQYEAKFFEVDTNSGTNAAWRLVAPS